LFGKIGVKLFNLVAVGKKLFNIVQKNPAACSFFLMLFQKINTKISIFSNLFYVLNPFLNIFSIFSKPIFQVFESVYSVTFIPGIIDKLSKSIIIIKLADSKIIWVGKKFFKNLKILSSKEYLKNEVDNHLLDLVFQIIRP
jgi:hypothetical protein